MFLFLLCRQVYALELPVSVTADSVILYDLDLNDVVYEKNPLKEEILASLTKVMTAYTVVLNVPDLNAKVKVSERDISNLFGFTCAGLEVGDRVSYLDLLYAMMLPSGADASQTLAYHVGGSIEGFNAMMNKVAYDLGLYSMHFEDSYGGSDYNVSTACDFITLMTKALENETFKKVFTTNSYTLSNGLVVNNYTNSIAFYHGYDSDLITGSKSGYTPEAGLLLVSTVSINGRNYLLLVMKSEENYKLTTHVIDSYKVIDYVKTQNYEERNLLKKGDVLKKIEVSDGDLDEYVVEVSEDIRKILSDDDYRNVTYDTHIIDTISSENDLGDNLGYVNILVGNELVSTYNVTLTKKINKREIKEVVISEVKKDNRTLYFLLACLLVLVLGIVMPRHLKFKGGSGE